MTRTSLLSFALIAGIILAAPASLLAQQIAFTMDDLPAHGPLPPNVSRMDVANAVLHALTSAGIPPTYGFINAVRVQEQPSDVAVLDAWRAHENLLGNHTWSHMDLNKNSAAAFEADLAADQPMLQAKMKGEDWHWLRFPYLSEGDTPAKQNAVRSYLAAQHYRIAAVTMSFSDYLWNVPYARCMAKGDTAAVASLETSYLSAAKAEALFELASSRKVYNREIPFVLLMHIGAFDARMLPRLLAQYKQLGFSFITLKAAESDPFYNSDIHLAEPPGPANLQTAASLKKILLKPPATPHLSSVCQ